MLGVTHVGLARDVNQDNFYVDGSLRGLEQDTADIEKVLSENGQWIAAVFDGMGGENDGEIASLIAAEITKRICEENSAPYDVETIIATINDVICAEMAARRSSMGSTCVFLQFDNDKYKAWNLGDSRAYRFHEGELIQLTKDHTEAAYYASIFMDEDIRIGSENKLTQHLGVPGDEFVIEPFATEWMPLREHDLIMICTDGLTHHATDEEIRGVFKREMDLREKKESLLKLALERGGLDNITIILIEACA